MQRRHALGLLAGFGIASLAAQTTKSSRRRTVITEDATTSKLRTLVAVPLEPGQEASLVAPVRFELGSADLTAGAEGLLGRLAEVLAEDSQASTKYLIEGHTDSSGSAAYNQGLSERRAKRVYDYLVLRAVPIERLQARGYGETRPLPGLAPADGRNRRVEIVRQR